MDLIATLSCPDRSGIVHAMTTAILESSGNIIENQQFTDPQSQTFVMRTRFEASGSLDEIRRRLQSKLANFSPDLTLRESSQKKRALILVSKESHCLRDLIYLRDIGELPIEIPLVISNHEDLRGLVESQGIKFLKLESDSKPEMEEQISQAVKELAIDFLVLARYMQILSTDFCNQYLGKIINIHHSFLPSFKGARPYHQALTRGVKIIGATAHFVTPVLDEGPIIEQDIEHITHSATLEQMISIGRDVERRVLAKAVRLYAEDRIFIVQDRTVVFE